MRRACWCSIGHSQEFVHATVDRLPEILNPAICWSQITAESWPAASLPTRRTRGARSRFSCSIRLRTEAGRRWPNQPAGFEAGTRLDRRRVGLCDRRDRATRVRNHPCFCRSRAAEASRSIWIGAAPPYIHERLDDPERYQTIYSSVPGSAAAPTAGLHFTDELIDRLRASGIGWAEVTLDIGLDTFRPVTVDDVADHVMHSETCRVSAETAALIAKTKQTRRARDRARHDRSAHAGDSVARCGTVERPSHSRRRLAFS